MKLPLKIWRQELPKPWVRATWLSYKRQNKQQKKQVWMQRMQLMLQLKPLRKQNKRKLTTSRRIIVKVESQNSRVSLPH
jgi:hypothetical protein